MGKNLKIFYASDIHGSEKCFLKFLNAAKFYKADVLIMGGDVTGKMIVPLVSHNGHGTYGARFLGRDFTASSETELAELEKSIRMNGWYPVRMDEEEHRLCQTDTAKRQELMDRTVLQSTLRWLDIAETRLSGTGIRCFINAGNDDDDFVDDALRHAKLVENYDGGVVDLDEHHQMVTIGHSNTTPFASPREMPEAELEAHIRSAASGVSNLAGAVFTLHAPPYATGLDLAPALEEDLKVVTKGGHTVMAPVGSTAVRKVIEDLQPLLGLHGHVHESRGTKMLGRTLCINAGSEYSEGVLRGALITLAPDSVKSHQLVQA
jgi:Icc-related predicted phosphoesterase